MLAKCLWKMYVHNARAAAAYAPQPGQALPASNGPTWEKVVETVVNAIESLPEKRERGREPILEPHYKLVSVTHKLLLRKVIDHEQGLEILQSTSYAHNINGPENADDWERYVLAVIKALRTADKSSWHHRMIARAAHVIYDDSNDAMVAYGAKHELTQQMFTKTMTVQVWKPEYERPGRHFVYTSRYTLFFIKLLVQTGDKANFEALAKRVRRKQTDFSEHSKLWQELCSQYLWLLRRVIGKIPEGNEDAILKSVNYEEFQDMAARLEAWCQAPTTQHPVLDVLRDVIELKRLNNGLMKATSIDDLIGDTYAMLYAQVGPTLPALPKEQQEQAQPPLATLQQQPSAQQGATSLPVSSITPVQVDGSADGPSNPNLPFSVFQPNQGQGQQGPSTDTTARPRTKAVGRREIQRKAEAASAKPTTTAPLTSHATMPIRSPSASTHPHVLVPVHTSPEMAEPSDPSPTKVSELQVPISGTATAAASVANAESAPASVHDDADDESELSELDESEVREIEENADLHDALADDIGSSRPMFPYLNGGKAKEGADESGTNTAEDMSDNQDETAEEL